ncbi:MAG: DUF87 domain-containing protein [Thomasclavelia sp.]|jgi:hypothetical protein|nr:DUF87 domain-containing protein [Thomasclavelia sp.]
MGIKSIVTKAAGKAGDAVAKVSVLSPEQVEKIDKLRENFFLEEPDPSDHRAEELTNKLLAANSVEIFNAYLEQISSLYSPISSTAEYEEPFDVNYNIRYINITKWVTDRNENNLDKLVNVYAVLSNENCNIALVFNRTRTTNNVYLAVTNNDNATDNNKSNSNKKRLVDAIKGNFPGAELNAEGIGNIPCLNKEGNYSIASASNIPTEKSEKFVSQTIEKLLDGIVPENEEEEYTIILLATPIRDIEERKLRLGEIYSSLTPYASWQTNFTVSDNKSFGSSATVGVNVGASVGSQNGTNQAITANSAQSSSDAVANSEGKNHNEGTSENETNSSGSSNNIGMYAGTGFNELFAAGVNASHGWNKSKSISKGKTVSDATSKAITNTVGRSLTKGIAKTAGRTLSKSLGANLGANFARTSSVTATLGKNEGIVQNFNNYNIEHCLEMLKEQMKRYEQSTALGMWDFAAYVISEDIDIANNVAHSYLALTQGEESYMSKSAVNFWRGDVSDNNEEAKEIFKYLKELRHPMFALNPNIVSSNGISEFSDYSDYLVYPSVVTATASLSGKELALSLNFPQKSIAGLPVIECAKFGRNVSTYSKLGEKKDLIHLGNVFHMNHEENIAIDLNKASLSSHTFITGSTGSGKSNTVYQILNEATKNDINFLVVEPAKGEYKHACSDCDDVSVYGTNQSLAPLLKLNPFSFPKGIHVLEHIDRLVEIFNVCWPMYAAMPAVLKNAVELSYKNCGWDLTTSINDYGDNLYPTFKDVCRNIKTIIDSSEYDNENKGAYKGSLLTRLRSLTNGIYGMIFNTDEITNEELFDKKVIVDLSRVGSTETKSLLMGILVLKLQEYRMTNIKGLNESIKHITVLEEAHNLLKRTSNNQSSESGNLLGKSVEMLANAIAEMRTYGEGFIIVDQAPGLLDMSTIRNTNTKIIMRLPDLSDRELVGKAANLTEDQITELAKLPLGVGAVYQNEWIEPVLCKIDRAKISNKMYEYTYHNNVIEKDNYDDELAIATLLSKCDEVSDNVIKDINEKMDHMTLDASTKVAINKWLSKPPMEPRMTKLAPIMSALFPDIKEEVAKCYSESNDPTEWTNTAEVILTSKVTKDIENQVRRDIIQSIITDYLYLDLNNASDLENWSKVGGLR